MQRFKGRSTETYRMKNKPVKEGFKFWGLCDSKTGYLVNFTPCGRTASAFDEYPLHLNSKILSFVIFLLQPLRDSPPPGRVTLVMDNYFTTQKVNSLLRDYNIGLVGTLKHRRGYPSSRLIEAGKNLKLFNEGVWDTDDAGNLIFKWVDNATVTLVTSVHQIDEVVTRSRRRPRLTESNRDHVNAVWGDSFRVDVRIPRAIDDYNQLMGGVDLFDQLRGYHEQAYRVRRNWVPLFLFTLNSAVTNAYIIHKQIYQERNDDPLTHKQFVMQFALALKTRSFSSRTRLQRSRSLEPLTKRRRISTKQPFLPPSRLINVRDHFLVRAPDDKATPKFCAYCSYEVAMAKKEEKSVPKNRRSRSICSICRVALCRSCFDDYHKEQ